MKQQPKELTEEEIHEEMKKRFKRIAELKSQNKKLAEALKEHE